MNANIHSYMYAYSYTGATMFMIHKYNVIHYFDLFLYLGIANMFFEVKNIASFSSKKKLLRPLNRFNCVIMDSNYDFFKSEVKFCYF